MKDSYELLIAKDVEWPYELSDSNKVELLQQAIDYFSEIEEYEKCAILHKKIEHIFNPPKKKRKRKMKNSENEK